MDLQEHILFGESDRSPEAPRLSLSISHLQERDSELGLLTSEMAHFGILFSLRYEGQPEETKSIVIQWESADAMRLSGFVLLHKTKDGLRKCNVPQTRLEGDRDRVGDVEIVQGRENTRKHMLSYEYHEIMQPGESYVFFWPGGEVDWWAWGTSEDHKDRSCRVDDIRNCVRPRLIIPASNALEFTGSANVEPCIERPAFERAPFRVANHWEATWRRRKDRRSRIPAPPFLTEADRAPGAPILRKTIEGPSKLQKCHPYQITETTTYVIPDGHNAEDLKPITLLDRGLTDSFDHFCESLYSVLPLSAMGLEALHIGHINWGFPLDDEPDDEIEIPSDDKVGEFYPASHQWCHTLFPGQSISLTCNMYPFDELEEILHVGASYRYRFNGKAVRWWDWGTKEDHRDTLVKKGELEKSGRPELIIPGVSFDFDVIL